MDALKAIFMIHMCFPTLVHERKLTEQLLANKVLPQRGFERGNILTYGPT